MREHERLEQRQVDALGEVADVADDRTVQAPEFLRPGRRDGVVRELQPVRNDVNVRGEWCHGVCDGVTIGKDDVAAREHVSIVLFEGVLLGGVVVVGVPFVKRAVIVDDIGDDDLGVECVDETGEHVVRRVHPKDRRTFSDPVPRQDRPHVLGKLLALLETGPLASLSGMQERVRVCPIRVPSVREPADRLPDNEPALVGVRMCVEVGLDQKVRCRRLVEVHDGADAVRPSEVLEEHVLTPSVDARVVLLPEHHDVVLLPGPDRSPALSRDARGQERALAFRREHVARRGGERGESGRQWRRRVQEPLEQRRDDLTCCFVAERFLEGLAASTRRGRSPRRSGRTPKRCARAAVQCRRTTEARLCR